MNTIERDGIIFKLPDGISSEEAKRLLDAMEQTGKVSESNFYRVINLLGRVRIRISDIPSHTIRDFGRVGVGAKTKELLCLLGATDSLGYSQPKSTVTDERQHQKKRGDNGLETFNGMQTTWEGLWYHPEYGGFSSASISLAQLKKFKGSVRVYVRKNKYYEKGSNRPNYCFCIKDSQSPTFTETEVIEDRFARLYTEEELQEEIRKATEGMYTREQVQKVMDGAAEDGMRGYGPGDNIIEDYI